MITSFHKVLETFNFMHLINNSCQENYATLLKHRKMVEFTIVQYELILLKHTVLP